MAKDASTEERILAAAREVFYQKGLGGARMEEIAQAADINKAMLHYYYRSKQKLFDQVFIDAFRQVFSQLAGILGGEGSVSEKIEQITAFYIQLLRENPQLPIFVLSSIQADAEGFAEKVFGTGDINPAQLMGQFMMQIQQEAAEGKIEAVDPRHLVLNMIGMSVFPFMLKPVLVKILQVDESAFDAFVAERKDIIPWYLKRAIEKPPQ